MVPAIRFAGFTDAWEQRKLGEVATEMVAGGDIDKDLIRECGRYPVIANALSGITIWNIELKLRRLQSLDVVMWDTQKQELLILHLL